MFDFLKRGRLVSDAPRFPENTAATDAKRSHAHLEYFAVCEAFHLRRVLAALPFLVFSGQQPEPTKNFIIALLVLATATYAAWINQPKSFSQNSRILLVFGRMLAQLGRHQTAAGHL